MEGRPKPKGLVCEVAVASPPARRLKDQTTQKTLKNLAPAHRVANRAHQAQTGVHPDTASISSLPLV